MLDHLQDIDPSAPNYDVHGLLKMQARISRELKREFESPRNIPLKPFDLPRGNGFLSAF